MSSAAASSGAVSSAGAPRRVHFLQHAPGEGPGALADWAVDRGHAATVTRLHRRESLPAADAFDCLVLLGGPMGVHDPVPAPWLADELRLVEAAVARGRAVVGVCLGAQVVAHALGAPVTRQPHAEVGWFPIERVPAGYTPDRAADEPLVAGLPDRLDAFHWHQDAFALPAGARHLWRSAACAHQGFAWGDRVLAVQFHPEVTPAIIRRFVTADGATLAAGGPWVQAADALLATPAERHAGTRAAFTTVLDRLLAPLAGR